LIVKLTRDRRLRSFDFEGVTDGILDRSRWTLDEQTLLFDLSFGQEVTKLRP
jgi:hypothetical protein